MKTILVPFDFSPHAINAFRFALNMARKSNAAIHLLYVIELPVLVESLMVPVNNYETAYHKELIDKSEKEFTKIKNSFKVDGISVVSKTEFGSPITKILAAVTKDSIDLVIIGCQGVNSLTEFLIGSTTAKVVRKSPVPVIVIKNFGTGEIKDIVFPNSLDTDHQDDLINKVKALQKFFHAKLHLVHINTPLNFSSDAIAYQKLDSFAARFGLTNFTANVYNNVDEKEGIRQFAKKVSGDMIAIGTHGHAGISRLVNGSLAEDVVADHSEIPIWTYSLNNESIDA